jgi:hypothetical protein
MKDVGIFMAIWSFFTLIWYILWRFGIFYGDLVYFFLFWYIATRKIWQPSAALINQGDAIMNWIFVGPELDRGGTELKESPNWNCFLPIFMGCDF